MSTSSGDSHDLESSSRDNVSVKNLLSQGVRIASLCKISETNFLGRTGQNLDAILGLHQCNNTDTCIIDLSRVT